MDNNNNNGDYSSPEGYNPDSEYGFSSDNGAQGGSDPYGSAQGGNASYGGSGGQDGSDPYGGGQYQQQRSGYDENGQYHSANEGQSGDYGYGGYDGGQGYGGGYNQGGGYNYGDGNYNYAPNGQPPLDKKGRPLENRFAMKLTFAIIETVLEVIGCLMGLWCFLVIPLVLSVIAIVMVCLQNKEYGMRNWSAFSSRSKTATVLLWVAFGLDMAFLVFFIVVVVLMVMGIGLFGESLSDMGYDNFGDFLEDVEEYSDEGYSEDEIERMIEDMMNGTESSGDQGGYDGYDDYDDYDNNSGYNTQDGENLYVDGFNEFTLNGAEVSLPVKVKDFKAAGFAFLEEDENGTLDSQSYEGFSFYDAEGEYLGTAFVYNVTDKEIKVSKGTVGGLTINEDDDVKLRLVNGITFDSSPDEAVAALGDPTGAMSDGDYLYLEWYMYNDYGTSIELDFDEGEMSEVWLMNDAELKAQIGY